MVRFYQNITGEKGEKKKLKNSAFFNQGKWKNFIDPMLPTDHRKDMTFVDIGCNAIILKDSQR